MGLTLKTAPAADPVSLAEVKQWLRISANDNAQDDILTMLIKSCTREAQNYVRRSFIAQTWTWEADSEDMRFPTVWLPMPTVNSITSVTTYDASGNTTVVSSSNYELVEGMYIASRNDGWEVNRRRRAATIVYSAGEYTDRTDVPADIRTAILKLVEHHYENRGNVSMGTIAPVLPLSTQELLQPYMYYRP